MNAHLAPDYRSIKNCANHYALCTPLQAAIVEHHALSSFRCHFRLTELETEEAMQIRESRNPHLLEFSALLNNR
jgi:hypothetical protein